MAALPKLQSDRVAAGTAYQAAVTELRKAYVELDALDIAIEAKGGRDGYRFAGTLAMPVKHPKYPVKDFDNIYAEISARTEQLLA